MRKLLLLLTIFLTVYGCNDSKNNGQGINLAAGVIPDQYIVIMKNAFAQPLIDDSTTSDTNTLKQKRAALTGKVKGYLESKKIKVEEKNIFVIVSVGAILKISPDEVTILRADSVNVEAVIQDAKIQINPIQQSDPSISNDPFQQWLSPPVPTDQINPIQQDDSIQNRYDIDPAQHMTDALSAAGGPVSGAGISRKIWFLDTGIDTDNPNLNVVSAKGTFFVGTSMNDDNGHGTFCAGVAAGKPVGTATGFPQIHIGVSEGAPVVPVKVLDSNGEGLWSNVILGLEWVAQPNYGTVGDIINLSFGVYQPGNHNCYADQGLKQMIRRLGRRGYFVTMSAGNDAGAAICNIPGCIDGPNLFTISSLNPDLGCAEYANFRRPVEYVTVGTRVFSLWDGGGFRMASGTSVSSAIMAGIIQARGTPPPIPGVTQTTCMGKTYTVAKR